MIPEKRILPAMSFERRVFPSNEQIPHSTFQTHLNDAQK